MVVKSLGRRWLPSGALVVSLLACEAEYRSELRAGDRLVLTNQNEAIVHYEKAIALGAAGQGEIKLARIYERQGKWELAADHFAKGIAVLPHDVEARHSRVRCLLEIGRLQATLEALRSDLSVHPNDAYTLLMYGALVRSPPDVEQAKALLEAAPQLSGVEYSAVRRAIGLPAKGPIEATLPAQQMLHLALVLEQTGRQPLAAELLLVAVAKYRHELTLWYPLLRAQLGAGDLSGAERTMFEMPPDVRESVETLTLQAQLLARQGKSDMAVTYLQRAVHGAPDYAPADRVRYMLMLAKAEADANRNNQALTTFEKALALDTSNVEARLGVAAMQLRLEQPDIALKETRVVLQREPLHKTARMLEVSALLSKREFEAAAVAANEYVKVASELVAAYVLRAKVNMEWARVPSSEEPKTTKVTAVSPQDRGRLDQARSDLNRALDMDPRASEVLAAWLRVEERLNGFPQAAEPVRQWIEQHEFWLGYVQLGSYFNEHGAPDLAEGAFHRATQLASGEKETWRMYATQLAAVGKVAECIVALNKLLELDPKNDTTFRELARMQLELNQTAEALQTYERWLVVNPNAVLALNNVAALKGENPATRDEAITLAERALTLSNNSPTASDTLGWLLFQRNNSGDRERALGLLKHAATQISTPVHSWHLARALEASGDRAAAKEAVASALASTQPFSERAEAAKWAQTLR